MRSCPVVAVIVLFVAAGTSGGVPGGAPATAPPGFELVSARTVPTPVEWAFDVRWLDDDAVAVSAGRDGVYELSLSDPEAAPRRIAGSDRLTYAGPLGVSESHLATSFPIGVLGWSRRGRPGAWRQAAPMGTIVDLDVAADHVLLLGARRVDVPGEEKRLWAPEGGILFRGELEGDLSALQRVMTARSGVDGKALEMARCDVLELGAVRFLSQGRYAVIPGVQPGVYVYAADGSLLRAWSGSSLGIYDDCDLGEEESARLAADPVARLAWRQRHAVVDDVVPWGDWFAAVVRTPRDGGAGWSFHPFGADGARPAVELPVGGGSQGLQVRADARGERLAVLLFDVEAETAGDASSPPKHQARLLVLERRQQ